mgnify:CR=1 FL=1
MKKTTGRRTSTEYLNRDEGLDNILRPRKLSDFIGNTEVISQLKVYIEAAKQRGEPLDHILFTGPPGLGKTTLAYIIAGELDSRIKVSAGPAFTRPYDLFSLLTNIEERDVVFIDEIHRLPRQVEEYLYSAMEDFKLFIKLDKGPYGKHIELKINRYTLVGATTRYGLLSNPIRTRFGIHMRLNMYKPEELAQIALRSASLLNLKMTEEAALEVATRSRGTPRICNNLIRRVRDYAQVYNVSPVTLTFATEILEKMGIDKLGLDETDKSIILTIINKFNGGPVGINNIANAINEEPDTIEEVYEPYLIQIGFIQRTPRGRIATRNAYQYFSINCPAHISTLF